MSFIDPHTKLPPLPELLAHSHLLSARQRHQSTIGPVGPLLCVHAEGARDGKSVAVDRLFAGTTSPQACLTALRNYQPAADHLLFVVDAPADRQQAFVRAGFRLQEVQWLMALALPPGQPQTDARPPSADETVPVEIPVEIRRAVGPSDALVINRIDGLEPVPFDEIDDPGLVHLYVSVQDEPVAYGRWAGYDEKTAWVSHIHTAPHVRGQGYASALMQHIRADIRSAGVERSLLLATSMAHALYTRLGYRDLATVAILQASDAQLRRKRGRLR